MDIVCKELIEHIWPLLADIDIPLDVGDVGGENHPLPSRCIHQTVPHLLILFPFFLFFFLLCCSLSGYILSAIHRLIEGMKKILMDSD